MLIPKQLLAATLSVAIIAAPFTNSYAVNTLPDSHQEQMHDHNANSHHDHEDNHDHGHHHHHDFYSDEDDAKADLALTGILIGGLLVAAAVKGIAHAAANAPKDTASNDPNSRDYVPPYPVSRR